MKGSKEGSIPTGRLGKIGNSEGEFPRVHSYGVAGWASSLSLYVFLLGRRNGGKTD